MRNKSWGSYKLKYDKRRQIGEHFVEMPELPVSPSEVLFIDEPSSEAYWKRDIVEKTYRNVWFTFIPHHTKLWQDATLEDDKGASTQLNQEDSQYIMDALELEVKRRTQGVFIRIQDEIVWIPGDMWFVLMWCKTKRPPEKDGRKLDYFDFRFFQLDFFYLVHHTIITPWILGLFISKPKKTGITNLMWLIYLNRITMTKNVNMGNMNIDLKKGAKTFRDYFMYAFNNLPPILKPQVKTISEENGVISFGKRGGSRKGSASFNDSADELGSTVMCVPCAPHAFDVDVFTIIWYDEPPKYINDFGEVYRSNSSGTSIQDFIVGKIFLTSYTPEDNGASFMAAKQLFHDSELSTIPQGEQKTKSKLICYHIPSHKSWWTSFDKFGGCNEREALTKIHAQRAIFKDRPKELQAEVRKYAIDKKEAWKVGGKGSLFDPMRIGDITDVIMEEQRDNPDGAFVPGNYRWQNELWNINPGSRPKGSFCPVYFQPLTEEERATNIEYTVREYNRLPPDQVNMALKFGKDEWGNLNSPPVFKNILGADPTQHAAASEVIEGSTNSYIVMSRYDPEKDIRLGKISSNIIMYEYFARPESPDDSYEDLLKMIIFTGALSAVEGNTATQATNLIAEGLGKYMMVKNKATMMPVIWDRWMGMAREPEKQYGLLRATGTSHESGAIKEQFVQLIKAYIRKPPIGGKDYGLTIKTERLMKDLGEINDIKDSTKRFDTFMAFGWCRWCDATYTLLLLIEEENAPNPKDMMSVMRALAPR